MNDKLAASEIANAELKNHIEDLEYDLSKTKQREEKLDMHLSECLTKLKSYNLTDADSRPPVSTVTQAKVRFYLLVHEITKCINASYLFIC